MTYYKLKIKAKNAFELLIESKTPEITEKEFERYMTYITLGNQNLTNITGVFKASTDEYYKNINTNVISEIDESAYDSNKNIIPVECEFIGEAIDDLVCNDNTKDENETQNTENTVNTITLNIEPAENDSPEEITEENEIEDIISEDNEIDSILNDDFGFSDTITEQKTEQKSEEHKSLTLGEYMSNTIVKTPIEEFVVCACYMSDVLNIKNFTLKLLNSKLYPVTRTLINHNVIEQAKSRMLIESVENNGKTEYYITDNAWNVYNYDLKRK